MILNDVNKNFVAYDGDDGDDGDENDDDYAFYAFFLLNLSRLNCFSLITISLIFASVNMS